MVVGVIVEKLRHVEPANGDSEPRNVPFAGQRERAVGHVFLFAAQAEGLASEEMGEHEPRILGAGLVCVRAWKILEAKAVAQAKALPHEQVHMKLGVVPQGRAEIKI